MTDWVMSERKGWGNHIEYLGNWRFTGHTTPSPQLGDFIITPCKTGADAVLRITKVKRPYDPPDQWFADVKPKDLSTDATRTAREY